MLFTSLTNHTMLTSTILEPNRSEQPSSPEMASS